MRLSSSLLMFADRAKYPEFPPEFAVYCGWLVFALVLLVGVLAWLRIESVRRYLLALDDPRVFAVLRIGFGLMTIICFLNLEPYWRMLWSDEGIFDLQYAQEKLGRQALRGWSPEEGFFDGWAVANFVWTKPSLFYFWGSPDFVVGYMLAFFAVLLLYTAGVFSRFTGLLAWFLMSGIYNRNALYWEGTDTVYRCFWFILLFAKTGHAWSFDNWWRCRRLRKQGRLEDPERPGYALGAPPRASEGADEGADEGQDPPRTDLEPIYRRVPAWPRYLFMLQLAALYCSTGSVKTGQVWADGDALYYALNMDHFYRFEWITQQVSYMFGTNLFRINTWVTHWWERLFPLVLIGVSLRFTLRHRDEPWYRAQDTWWRRWGARAVLVAIWGVAWRINYLVLPFCLEMVKDAPVDPRPAITKIHIVWGVVIPLVVAAWYALGRWPITLLRRGRALPWITDRVPWLYIPELRLTQDTLRGWLLGRRLWLTLGFIFHGFLILFMNIGMFPFIMLMTYAAFVTGEEHARVYKAVLDLARKIKGVRKVVPKGYERWFVPSRVNPIDDSAFNAAGVAPFAAAAVLWALVAAVGIGWELLPHELIERTAGGLFFAALALILAVTLELRGRRARLLGLPASAVAALYCGWQLGEWTGTTIGLLAGAAVGIAVMVELRRRGHGVGRPQATVPGRTIPDLVVLGLGLLGAGLIWAKSTSEPPEWIEDVGNLAWQWVLLCAAVALLFQMLPARAKDLQRAREPGPKLAYGAFGRALVVFAVVYHSAAVGLSLLPSYPILNKWRTPAASIFGAWLRGTGTNQSWRMFAPNPPRSNTFLKTVVVEQDGRRWDMRNNAFHYRPNPWIWNDRMRKMQRRMAGKGKWYLRYWASWHCREWALENGGVSPREVEISKIFTRIPPPDAVAEKGPYHPRKLQAKERPIQTHGCKGEGELPLYMKERYGLPITEADIKKAEREAEQYARKFRDRRKNWDNRRDWGNWDKAAEEEERRKERAEQRREQQKTLAERRRERMHTRRPPPDPYESRPAASAAAPGEPDPLLEGGPDDEPIDEPEGQ